MEGRPQHGALGRRESPAGDALDREDLLVRLAGKGGVHDPTEGQDVVEGRAELRGTQLARQERDLERVRLGVLSSSSQCAFRTSA